MMKRTIGTTGSRLMKSSWMKPGSCLASDLATLTTCAGSNEILDASAPCLATLESHSLFEVLSFCSPSASAALSGRRRVLIAHREDRNRSGVGEISGFHPEL